MAHRAFGLGPSTAGRVVMAAFEKRPSRVQAIQFRLHEGWIELCAFLGGYDCADGEFTVRTWRGDEQPEPGDWIVRDEAGQIHVYKDADFRAAYRAVTETRP